MEFPPLLTFPYFFVTSPLSNARHSLSLTHPSTLLAALFILHYINRSIVSTLRMPSRARIHMAVIPMTSVFNAANGFAMAAYLSSPLAHTYLLHAFTRPIFYVFLAMWTIGFIGNIAHDEILYELRRNPTAKKKSTGTRVGKNDVVLLANKEWYGVPHGLLYKYISFPNYLCELFEWLAFALAAAPLPPISKVIECFSILSFNSILYNDVPPEFAHPYLFLVATLLPMVPRAYRAHRWYHKTFPQYPKERKAIVPFVF
jgi:3-oxo-5-alpha-steroid 4-dehydrogenase 1